MAVVVTFRQMPGSAVLLGPMVAITVWLSAIDFAVHRLPNIVVLPFCFSVIVSLATAGLITADFRRTLVSLGVGLLMSIVFLMGNLIGVIGMGDVKYSLPLFSVATWFGFMSFQTMLMVMTISATVVMIGVSVKNRSSRVRIAYGPYMSLGLIAALLTTAP